MRAAILCLLTVTLVLGCTSNTPMEGAVTLQNQRVEHQGKNYSLIFEALGGKELKVGAFTVPNKAIHYVYPGKKQVQLKVTRGRDIGNGVYGALFVGDINLEPNGVYKMTVDEVETCVTVTVVNSANEIVYGPEQQPFYVIGSTEYLLVLLGRSEMIEKPSGACDGSRQ